MSFVSSTTSPISIRDLSGQLHSVQSGCCIHCQTPYQLGVSCSCAHRRASIRTVLNFYLGIALPNYAFPFTPFEYRAFSNLVVMHAKRGSASFDYALSAELAAFLATCSGFESVCPLIVRSLAGRFGLTVVDGWFSYDSRCKTGYSKTDKSRINSNIVSMFPFLHRETYHHRGAVAEMLNERSFVELFAAAIFIGSYSPFTNEGLESLVREVFAVVKYLTTDPAISDISSKVMFLTLLFKGYTMESALCAIVSYHYRQFSTASAAVCREVFPNGQFEAMVSLYRWWGPSGLTPLYHDAILEDCSKSSLYEYLFSIVSL